MTKITLYHGTAHDFDAFDDRFRQRGTEHNSCLGIHLTQNPEVAADYAEMATRDANAGQARVLVVELEVGRVALVVSEPDFMGRDGDDDFSMTRPSTDFIDARERLLHEGFTAIAVDAASDDLSGAWVALNHSDLVIVGSMTLDQAYEAEPTENGDINFELVQLFEDDAILPALH